jgi:hypothetical protein
MLGIGALLGGALLSFFGLAIMILGVVICFQGSVLSGHVPGALIIGQGLVLALVGTWLISVGRRVQASATRDA